MSQNSVTLTLIQNNFARPICCLFCKSTIFRTDMLVESVFEGDIIDHKMWIEVICKQCKTLYRINLPYKKV